MPTFLPRPTWAAADEYLSAEAPERQSPSPTARTRAGSPSCVRHGLEREPANLERAAHLGESREREVEPRPLAPNPSNSFSSSPCTRRGVVVIPVVSSSLKSLKSSSPPSHSSRRRPRRRRSVTRPGSSPVVRPNECLGGGAAAVRRPSPAPRPRLSIASSSPSSHARSPQRPAEVHSQVRTSPRAPPASRPIAPARAVPRGYPGRATGTRRRG